MQTDRDRFLELFRSLGVEWAPSEGQLDVYEVNAKDQEKVHGYSGFVCTAHFTPDGEFLHLGIWE